MTVKKTDSCPNYQVISKLPRVFKIKPCNSEKSVARKFVLGFPSFIARKVCDKTGEIEFGHLLGNINL